MEIHPIKTEADYDAALEELVRLWGSPEGSEDGDGLDVMLVLVENYESKQHPIDSPEPIEAIKFRMEQMDLARKDLEPLIGSRGRVSEVFNRRRYLSLPMIRRLHSQLHIPLESFDGVYKKIGCMTAIGGTVPANGILPVWGRRPRRECFV